MIVDRIIVFVDNVHKIVDRFIDYCMIECELIVDWGKDIGIDIMKEFNFYWIKIVHL